MGASGHSVDQVLESHDKEFCGIHAPGCISALHKPALQRRSLLPQRDKPRLGILGPPMREQSGNAEPWMASSSLPILFEHGRLLAPSYAYSRLR